MEENRSFIIILSVTLVVAALFGAASWLFYPYQQAEVGVPVASRFFRESTPVENVQPDETVDEIGDEIADEPTDEPEGSLQIVYGILDDANFIDDPLGRQLLPVSSEISTTSNLSVEIQTRTPARELGGQSSAAPTSTAAPVASAPADTTQEATRRTASVSTVTPPPAEEFWIQVLSTPSRDRIEQVQKELESYGLGGRITTTRIDEVTYYRLRYGPYTQRAEAQKFLDWIKESPRFVDSFISLEYRSSN